MDKNGGCMVLIKTKSFGLKKLLKEGFKFRSKTLINTLSFATIFGSLTIFFTCKSFIYDIKVLRKWDNINKRYSYFIGLGDFHDRAHRATDLQIGQIDDFVKRCTPQKTKLILEDICSEPNNGVKFCPQFNINSTGGILGAIADRYRNFFGQNNGGFCRSDFVDNVEYRFCRVASLAPVINNINIDCKNFISTSKIYINCFKNEIINAIGEIKSYDDKNKVLQDFYKNSIALVNEQVKKLKFNENLGYSVADYINLYKDNKSVCEDKNKLNLVKKLLVFDSCLLDSKILHSIFKNFNNKQNFIVIAGGSHIKSVSSVLIKIGYEKVYESVVVADIGNAKNCDKGVIFGRKPGVENCASSAPDIDNCKPAPADLTVLDKFI